MEIQSAVHKIYQQLSVTLDRALQANKHHIGDTRSFFFTGVRQL